MLKFWTGFINVGVVAWLGIGLSLLILQPSMAQNLSCLNVGLKTCPSFFVDSCTTDQAFQSANVQDCLRAITNQVSDRPECAGFNPKSCQQKCSENPQLDAIISCTGASLPANQNAGGAASNLSDHDATPQCQQIKIEQCPSFFLKRCSEDPAFQNQNTQVCLKIVTGQLRDDHSCPAQFLECENSKPRDCSAIEDVAKQSACELNLPRCMGESIYGFSNRFDKLALDVSKRLGDYKGVLDLNPAKISREELCNKYALDDMKKFYSQASDSGSTNNSLVTEANDLDSCTSQITQRLEELSKDVAITEIFADVITNLKDRFKGFSGRRTELQTSINKLEGAKPTLRKLLGLHVLDCPPKQ